MPSIFDQSDWFLGKNSHPFSTFWSGETCDGLLWIAMDLLESRSQNARVLSTKKIRSCMLYDMITIYQKHIVPPAYGWKWAVPQEWVGFLFRLGSKDMCSMISNPRSGWPVLAVQMAQSRAIRCGSGDYQKRRQCQCASYLRGMTSKDARERSRVIMGKGKDTWTYVLLNYAKLCNLLALCISGKIWVRSLCRMVANIVTIFMKRSPRPQLINQHFHTISDIVGVKLLCAIVVPDEWSSFWYWKSFLGDSTGYYTKNNRSILPIRRTNISPHLRHFLKMIIVFARWDMWSFPEVVVRFGWLLTPKGDVQSSRPWHSGFGYPILQEQYVFV